jgi:hypothetical protein
MKRLILSPTDYTPAIDLNPSSLTMTFTGISRPENVGLFYQQVFEWISDLSEEMEQIVPGTLKLILKLDYCNSSSQKYLLIVLEKLIELKEKGLGLIVEWWYDEGDDKMLEDGEDIADAIGLPVIFKPF